MKLSCALGLLLFGVGSATAQPVKLTVGAPMVVNTEYFDLTATEYRLSEKLRGSGGALLPIGDGLIYASAEGFFFRVDPRNHTYERLPLPELKLGAEEVVHSKRITFRELLPRVMDVA